MVCALQYSTTPSEAKVVKQEATLTLRGQCGRCRNIKGEPRIFGSFPSSRPRPIFPLGVVL